MNNIVFITDADTEFGEELVSIFLSNGFSVFATVSEPVNTKIKTLFENFSSYKDNLKLEVWNRKSPASARNILLKVVTQFREINKVFIIGNPVLSNIKLDDMDFTSIELYIDNYIKGDIFLIKEIIKYFKDKENKLESDVIALINMNTSQSNILLDNIIKCSFTGIINTLLETTKSNGLNICGFETKSNKFEEFAGYIYRLIENKSKRISGRFLKFSSGIILK